MRLREATVEDVREALGKVTQGVGDATARQYVLRVKSLLGYAHKLGFAPFNAGARIITPAEVALLIRAAPSKRDRVLLEVAYAGGIRVSEIVALNWADVLPRDQGRVQLSILGKGGKVRSSRACRATLKGFRCADHALNCYCRIPRTRATFNDSFNRTPGMRIFERCKPAVFAEFQESISEGVFVREVSSCM
jgi:site-specific recombinase XerD